MTYKDIQDAISSPESGCGITPCNSPDGRTNDLFGQDHAPASRFLLPDDEKVRQMLDTYGQNGNASSASAALQRSLENRLKARLPRGGLTMFIKGWKRKATPSGRLYSQLVVSAHPIEETDWALWAACNTMDHLPVRSEDAARRQFSTTRKNRSAPANLREQVDPHCYPAALWVSPTAQDGSRGGLPPRPHDKGIPLSQQVTLWPTTSATKNSKNSEDPQTMKEGGVQTSLADAVWIASKSLWATTTTRDHKDGEYCPNVPENCLLGRQVWSGSDAQTEKRGSLNPEFAFWLMGIPLGFISSMQRAMQSFRSSGRSSSGRSLKLNKLQPTEGE